MERKSIVALLVVATILVSGTTVVIFFQGLHFGVPDTTITTTDSVTTLDPYENYSLVEDLLESTFDGHGFAAAPGENSTFETTFRASELVQKCRLWDSPRLADEFNATRDYIMSFQAGLGGFRLEGDIYESPQGTALCSGILNRLRMMDASVLLLARMWLAGYYKGLTLDRWLTQGVLEGKNGKWWGLRAAVELGSPGYCVKGGYISVEENVFNQGDDIPPLTDPIIYRGELHFGETVFDTNTLSRRLMFLETFICAIKYPQEGPEIINLLVNTTNTVNEIVSTYNSTTGLFANNLETSARFYRLLSWTGNLSLVFPEPLASERMNSLQEFITDAIDFLGKRYRPGETIESLFHLSQIYDTFFTMTS